MGSFDNVTFVPVAGGRKMACSVCCRHFGHDCDLVEMQTVDGRRFLICFGPGCEGCGFIAGIELSDAQILQAAGTRIEELQRQRVGVSP